MIIPKIGEYTKNYDIVENINIKPNDIDITTIMPCIYINDIYIPSEINDFHLILKDLKIIVKAFNETEYSELFEIKEIASTSIEIKIK